jgi:hypothetical protein
LIKKTHQLLKSDFITQGGNALQKTVFNREEPIPFFASVNTDRVYKDFDTFIAEESAKPEGEKVEVVSCCMVFGTIPKKLA